MTRYTQVAFFHIVFFLFDGFVMLPDVCLDGDRRSDGEPDAIKWIDNEKILSKNAFQHLEGVLEVTPSRSATASAGRELYILFCHPFVVRKLLFCFFFQQLC